MGWRGRKECVRRRRRNEWVVVLGASALLCKYVPGSANEERPCSRTKCMSSTSEEVMARVRAVGSSFICKSKGTWDGDAREEGRGVR